MLLSIIIPVYNAEKYLRDTLTCITKNVVSPDYEVIIVNDGSKDSSIDILKEFAVKYKFINVIDKDNEGVSNARNIGIERSRGEYIFFMDADDLVAPYFFDAVIPVLRNSAPDILAWEYATFYKKPHFAIMDGSKVATVQNDKTHDTAFNYLMKAGCAVSPCTKAVRRSILDDIRFDEKMTYGEDMFFSWKTILKAKKILYINCPLYYYRQTRTGAVSRYHANLYESYSKGFDSIREFICQYSLESDSLLKDVDYHFARRLPALVAMECKAPYSDQSKEERIRTILLNQSISRALHNDSRLTGKIFELARKGYVAKMIRITKLNAIKNKLLFPIKQILK